MITFNLLKRKIRIDQIRNLARRINFDHETTLAYLRLTIEKFVYL